MVATASYIPCWPPNWFQPLLQVAGILTRDCLLFPRNCVGLGFCSAPGYSVCQMAKRKYRWDAFAFDRLCEPKILNACMIKNSKWPQSPTVSAIGISKDPLRIMEPRREKEALGLRVIR
jgi:hypothetical protein